MLWSLIKIALFICLIAAATYGAGLLLNASGGVLISFGGMEYNLGALQAVIALVLLLLALWLLLKLASLMVAFLRFLNGDETAITRYFDRNRERKGFKALADGLMALASGEGREAMQQASRAEKYLDRPELTNLLAAQAAEMAGDHKKAEETYKALLRDDRTRFVGVRGIMKQKLAEGDTDTAMKLAEKAFSLKPRHMETQDTLLRLQAEKEDWSGARKTLSAKLKHGTLPRDVYRRRDAVLALSEAKDIFAEGQSIEAREAAVEANRLSPDLIPAAVMAARGYIADGKPKYATRLLVKAWQAQPHPELATAFAEIAPNEGTAIRLHRFNQLTKYHKDHPETRMLLAELNIANEDYSAARKAIGDLATEEPSARSLTIMAAIERGQGSDDAVVRGWLAKALTASRGPQWVCDNCNTVNSDWSPTCINCGALDTLSWRVPSEGTTSLPGGAEMLPLLVGQSAGKDLPPEIQPDLIAAETDPSTPDPEQDPEVETITDAEIITDAGPRKD